MFFAYPNDVRLSTDPIIYSSISRTVADSGDYGSLRIGDVPYYRKPPLLFWLSALAIKIFGAIPFAVTLFPRLFGLASVFVTGWLGRLLYGEKVGWVSAFVLMTTYIFVSPSTTFRLDSALVFAITLSMVAYLKGEQKWGPPIFYIGIIIGVLTKGPPGILPLVLAPLHALLSGSTLPIKKRLLRWLVWSPLLFIPLAWWGYLIWKDGFLPVTVLMGDMVRSKASGLPRFRAIWNVYVLGFLFDYWPWLPFTLVGGWLVYRDAFRVKLTAGERASAALLFAWIGITFAGCAIKNAQYFRYVLLAIPAFSILAAAAVVRFAGNWFLDWVPKAMTPLALTAAVVLACLPVVTREGEEEQYSAIAQILDQRYPPTTPVPLIASKTRLGDDPNRYRPDRARSLFFFNRWPRLMSIEEVKTEAAQKRFTLLVRTADYERVVAVLPVQPLIIAKSFVLAEIDLSKE